MTSSRLPGKILIDVAGRPMLSQQLRRLAACRSIDEIVIATTTNGTDDPVVELARREGVRWFRGGEHDVLDRYVGAARAAAADLVVRVTADCPLIDPNVTALVIDRACDATRRCDYASNTLERTYPRGLDTEAFHRDVLERCSRMASSAPAREHVTWYMHRERPDLFVSASIVDTDNNSDLRWTVDTEDDLALIRAIYDAGGLAEEIKPYPAILELVRRRPALMALNAHVVQKST